MPAAADFSLVMRPYRTQENQVDGVVLALIEKSSAALLNAWNSARRGENTDTA